jgi:hypothetical protein
MTLNSQLSQIFTSDVISFSRRQLARYDFLSAFDHVSRESGHQFRFLNAMTEDDQRPTHSSYCCWRDLNVRSIWLNTGSEAEADLVQVASDCCSYVMTGRVTTIQGIAELMAERMGGSIVEGIAEARHRTINGRPLAFHMI